MTKLLELFNTLLKYKIIKHPRGFLIILLIIGILGIPKYLNQIVEKGFENVLIKQNNADNKLIKYRTEISPKIDDILKGLRYRTNSDRVFLGEYSNTVKGISGLHFLYFTINNEDVKYGVLPISDQYQKQNSFNFKFNSKLITTKLLAIRDIEDLKDDDPLTYYMIKKNNTNQLFLMYFELDDTPIGFIGISFEKNTPLTNEEIFYKMSISLRDLQDLFDYKEKIK